MRNLKIQDGGGRHLGFNQMLITSAFIELFGWNLNCTYLGITEIGKFHQNCDIFENPRWRPAAILDLPKCNNFRMDWAFWLTFELHILWHNKNWKISPELAIFWKSKMAVGRHLGFTKLLITSAWIELFGWNLNCIYLGITEIGKFHQKCQIFKSKMAAAAILNFEKY